MFGLNEDAASSDAGVDEEIEHGKGAYFLILLYKKLTDDGIVIVSVVLCEVIENDSGLQIQCAFEKIIVVIQCIPGDKIGNVEYVVVLVDLLVKQGVVKAKTPDFYFLVYFKRQIFDGISVLLRRYELQSIACVVVAEIQFVVEIGQLERSVGPLRIGIDLDVVYLFVLEIVRPNVIGEGALVQVVDVIGQLVDLLVPERN